MAIAATASLVPVTTASAGVSKLPAPNPVTEATAPAMIATNASREAKSIIQVLGFCHTSNSPNHRRTSYWQPFFFKEAQSTLGSGYRPLKYLRHSASTADGDVPR